MIEKPHIQCTNTTYRLHSDHMTSEIYWCKLTHSGVLSFDGPDAKAFLQGQLTNDINAITGTRSQYAGYCTPKGRLLASMLLWLHDGAYHILLPRALCEPVRKRLSMYILRAKVKAADVSEDYVLFGLAGTQAAALTASLAASAPAAIHDVVHGQGVSALMLPVQRFLIVAKRSQAARVEAALADAATESPATLWDALDIEAGIPSVVTATQEQFVPQTVNFDLIGAVSFDKGCYPGQEIVARTHYLGKVKQRMVRARITANVTLSAPTAGDKLYVDAFGDQASGMIVAATAADNGTYDVLAVVQTSSLEGGAIHWQSPTGPALRIETLPYVVK